MKSDKLGTSGVGCCKSDGPACVYYGWVVVLAASFIRILAYGITYTSGVVYVVILENFGSSKGETAWVSSLVLSVMYLVTPLSGMLINRFGWRSVAFAGGLAAFGGLLVSSFSTNLATLAIMYGIISGGGCGIAYMPGSVAVPKYFNSKQNLALGLASAGGGLGTFIFPPIITFLNHRYGWRGMFMILSSIALNICVFGLLYRPLEQNDVNKNDINEKNLKKRRNSTRVKNDFSFCRCWLFHIIAINNFLYCFGASIIFGHLAAYAKYEIGLPETESVLLYSACGITITFAKIGQGFLADLRGRFWVLNPLILYMAFYMLGGVATLCLLIKTNYVGLLFYAIAFGCSYAANGGSLVPAILIDLAGKDQLALTYSVVLASTSLGYITGAPVAGWLYDRMHTYNHSFVLAAAVMIVSAIIMVFPYRFIKPKSHDDISLVVGEPKSADSEMKTPSTEHVELITRVKPETQEPTLEADEEERRSLL